ncbi:MAG: hypothetical protein II027_05870, partial [Bacteroidales bacterium]|nr:hypothetical protein [Bacteroidales bacterium]
MTTILNRLMQSEQKQQRMCIAKHIYCGIKHICLLCAIIAFTTNAYSQTKFAGRVTDTKTKEPLAFVNIIYNAKNQGTS